jgi:hypothetical protein
MITAMSKANAKAAAQTATIRPRERVADIYDPHFPIRPPASGRATFDRTGRETYDPHFPGQRRA